MCVQAVHEGHTPMAVNAGGIYTNIPSAFDTNHFELWTVEDLVRKYPIYISRLKDVPPAA